MSKIPKHLYLGRLRSLVGAHQREYSNSEIFSAAAQSPLRRLRLIPTDRKYRVVDEATLRLLLQRSQVSNIKYVAEYWDCDDYAMALAPELARLYRLNSVGIVIDYSGGHAYNCAFVRTDAGAARLVIIEPQTDGFVKVGQQITNAEIYKAEDGYILL